MKKIFVSLLALVLGFLSTERAVAQKCFKVDGQVRYGFELKKLTKTEADAAQAQGYVDLWAYACFDEAFVQANMIQLSGSQITFWGIQMGNNSHGYVLVDKNGNFDPSGAVARFAAPSRDFAGCAGSDKAWQVSSAAVSGQWFQVCPDWGYGRSANDSRTIESDEDDIRKYCTIIQDELGDGKTWYCLKMYQVRFQYKQAKSFYVQFTTQDRGTDQAYAGTNFNFYAYDDGSYTTVGWPTYTCGAMNRSWSNHVEGRWGAIRGGVEVIADPDMQLTAEAACGGSDVTGKLNVNDWAGKDWSNYGSVKFYVNATGGSVSGRKLLNSGSDITASVPATGSTAPIAYTLTPAGYTLSTGNPADSLIWVIEDTFLA